jgi:hypothetical protein
MRDFVKCSLGLVSFAAVLSDSLFAQNPQPSQEIEEVVVRAKPLNRYRAEIEVARDEMIRLFNEANEGDDNDVRCRYETPTGTRIPMRVCFSAAQDSVSANAGRDFLQALGRGDAFASATAGLGSGQNAAGGDRAMVAFENEWRRVMGTDQQFRDAVVTYRELENEYDRARAATIRMPIPSFSLNGPQCEASTYTEYEQLGNVARVRGTVSISACPAGTRGTFAVVTRVTNDDGTVTPIEFSEVWQSADAEDYVFFADYPIGDDVSLESVRVRALKCTCEGPTQ